MRWPSSIRSDKSGRARRSAEIGGSEGKIALASKAPVDAAGAARLQLEAEGDLFAGLQADAYRLAVAQEHTTGAGFDHARAIARRLARHDFGDKQLLGQTVKGRGAEELDQVLDLLVAHPSTARFISRKLAQYFLADEPPAVLVDSMATAFHKSGGDIKAWSAMKPHEFGFDWIRKGQPLCLIGDSGTGKSHLLIGLGAAAAEHGYRVKYVLATRLVNELVEAADEKQLARTIARYGRVDLLLLDELGYMELDKRGAELLFQVLTEREEKNSVAIASNESFSGWTKTFTDPRLCAAIVDRLTFGGNIIETGTDSYRLAHTRAQQSA